eukprot:12051198-Alexandrium_andersonii.AAC.1
MLRHYCEVHAGTVVEAVGEAPQRRNFGSWQVTEAPTQAEVQRIMQSLPHGRAAGHDCVTSTAA